MTENAIVDRVANDAEGAREIGFAVPGRYNASAILFDNLDAGRGGKVAVHSPAGSATYGELCATAGQVGNALKAAGLKPLSRVLMLLNDTPAYPAAFFGAVRAGFVPVLINTLSPNDLVGYFLGDSGAEVAIVESDLCHLLSGQAVGDAGLRLVVAANGPVPDDLPVEGVAWTD